MISVIYEIVIFLILYNFFGNFVVTRILHRKCLV